MQLAPISLSQYLVQKCNQAGRFQMASEKVFPDNPKNESNRIDRLSKNTEGTITLKPHRLTFLKNYS
jgi:hypothetical protein